jgi:mRNA interferase MazF
VSRGDLVLVAAKGEFTGKPRPGLVVQADLFNATHPSVTVCLVTSELHDAPLFRPTLAPSPENGLQVASQVMVDKLVSVRRETLGRRIGRLDPTSQADVDRALRLWLDLP